ncbi:MAG: hypothetical protein U1C96_04795 [Gallionella sp.]|nr:hypothetical protein [Gallionella sp.]
MNAESTVDQTSEIQHLLEQHGLKRTVAFIPDSRLKEKTGNATRQARHRQKMEEMGMVKADIPIQLAEAIKAAGSYAAWRKQFVPVTVEAYKRLKLDEQLAHQIHSSPKWKRGIINLLLKL